jgi:hypothetical protein
MKSLRGSDRGPQARLWKSEVKFLTTLFSSPTGPIFTHITRFVRSGTTYETHETEGFSPDDEDPRFRFWR